MRLTFPRFAVLTLCGGALLALAFRLSTPPDPPGPADPLAAGAPEPYPNSWPDPPPPDVAALLGGLGPGSDLGGGWRVRGVSPVLEQRIVIDVDKAGVGFRVALTTKGRDSARAAKEHRALRALHHPTAPQRRGAKGRGLCRRPHGHRGPRHRARGQRRGAGGALT